MLTLKRRTIALAVAGFYLFSFASKLCAELPYSVDWARQFGTADQDSGSGVSVDSGGNAYVTGAFGNDGYLNKFDASGNLTWSRIISTADYDSGRSVTSDGLGNSYATGITWGNLYAPSAGQEDIFLVNYDALGNTSWSRQFGASGHDYSLDVAVDQLGNSYINGTPNAFLSGMLTKLDPSGATVWARNILLANSIATDNFGNVFAVADGSDSAYITKYDSNGFSTWTRFIDTPELDQVADVVIDASGNAYIAGHTQGGLAGPSNGGYDAFVIKYNSAGNVLWTRQIGSSGFEYTNSIALDGFGNLYIAGVTDGNFPTSSTGGDTFIVKYNSSGDLLWTKQMNTGGSNEIGGSRIAANSSGNLYVSGTTFGNIIGSGIGHLDAYLLKLSPVPEPSSTTFLLFPIATYFVLCRCRPSSCRRTN